MLSSVPDTRKPPDRASGHVGPKLGTSGIGVGASTNPKEPFAGGPFDKTLSAGPRDTDSLM
ncbi:hypothetical protein GGD53_005045 [Rhizobium aethiopicum]|uniref:Uncharacterized protein n=1 Tax=Rhizobium aethiopicum TaxID=1138170 RepID=A0A7W6VRF5_9HYPH|nr:hypothetical protein [Rhizobium aethiopicum]